MELKELFLQNSCITLNGVLLRELEANEGFLLQKPHHGIRQFLP